MFSVVIPTMWRYEPFLKFLEDLTRFELVDDIIIINNDVERTPSEEPRSEHYSAPHPVFSDKKIRLVNQPKNIFCNPAWNLGVLMAKNDRVCLMNDDLIFDLRVFYRVSDETCFSSSWDALFGMTAGDPVNGQEPLKDGAIDLVRWTPSMSTFGFGQLMFVHKPSWVPIPDDLKLYYGDDWIFSVARTLNKKIYLIQNMLHKTPFAVTSSEMKGNRLEEEKDIYDRAIKKFYLNQRAKQHMEATFLRDEYAKAYAEPSDINEHIPTLFELANKCETVMEFGVRTGVSTRAFLCSRAAVWSVDINPLPEAIQLFLNAQSVGKICNITQGDTLQITINPTDLLFIDTHHEYDQLTAELERHHEKVNKFIAMHDTESYPDLMKAVFHFLTNHGDQWALSEHYPNNNGLTVLKRIGS